METRERKIIVTQNYSLQASAMPRVYTGTVEFMHADALFSKKKGTDKVERQTWGDELIELKVLQEKHLSSQSLLRNDQATGLRVI